LFIELRRRCRNTRLVSEFRTSQICSKCTERLDQTRFWGLKKCNNTCLTLWDRDVNAARNIRHVFLHRNQHGLYPEAFRRGIPQA
jgi:transposase